MLQTNNIPKLRQFVTAVAELVDKNLSEPETLKQGGELLRGLVAVDDWLPEAFAQPHPDYYQQYLLYADARQRFSIVSFVWGPGQATPIHNHTVWGLIGMLRGVELSQSFDRDSSGRLIKEGDPIQLVPGQVEYVSPTVGDYHQVRNGASDGKASISIHVYGANIGAVKRSVFYENGTEKPFISGYSNTVLPNLWDLSKEVKK